MKITLPIIGYALLASVSISLFFWCYFVLSQFDVSNPWISLPLGLWNTFEIPYLRSIAWQSLAMGFIPIVFLLCLLVDWGGSGERILRGMPIIPAKELTRRTRLKHQKDVTPVQVTLANVPIPLVCETRHFLCVGSTGKGKTVAMSELMAGAMARRDRCIVVDPNGYYLARFGKKGDTILNPFDKRSANWSPFNEIRNPYDYPLLAKSIVPDSLDPTSQEWHGYARQLCAETMRSMAQAGENTSERLLYWLTIAPTSKLSSFVAGTAASGLFEPGAEKALASTRFILSNILQSFQYLREGNFSLSEWLQNGQGNLYLVWREDMLESLKPLFSAWVDILLAETLSRPTDNARPLWLFLDELASLEHLNSLEAGLTKGRKHGLRIVAGLQTVAQLDAIYGQHHATTLRACFLNLLALGGSNTDPVTAQILSDGLGDIEIERVITTHNQGENGVTTSKSLQRVIEKLVLPTELMNLAPLDGYLKLDGDFPVAKIRLTPMKYPVRVRPFLEG